MIKQELCKNCNQKHNCGSIYQQLGNTKSSSVVIKVVIAFLVPLVVFIISLAIFEEIFAKTFSNKPVQTALSTLLAVLVTLSCIVITRFIKKRHGKVG